MSLFVTLRAPLGISIEHLQYFSNSDSSFQSEPDFLTCESFDSCLTTMQSICHSDTVNTFLSPWPTPSAVHATHGKASSSWVLALLL